jgi:hypothetical protein
MARCGEKTYRQPIKIIPKETRAARVRGIAVGIVFSFTWLINLATLDRMTGPY